ncbi:crotonase/enoyl-CoA hydratase family protein [Frankia sp. CNm7]|uniref:Crotonase/enoyl-CoA hydratase family protein n=1 Tax=Frankia nepalensis TaxID=1836974 RepID=A0A937RMM7_9ACTN|nr:crotonase/enoyl-CoA hydratase family protein [Frankia nepalensis]MBL7496468.1 crotonase/enoyl-CoA hydratase family protein [Frankia nepalensis]MBL7510795.1 crotonase/enoyl-CoA hydratase family protein [Frankia nepalensis]MBL7521895.1 crotonase/enoyl-CoA hydratase family protein [Frankia nepalensis]MBL7631594.1 crotonase/enoyl-CoA hydratase family protein [Frankia nepalensis]
MAGGGRVGESGAEPLVLVEADGPVLTVTLNRPEKRNATNAEVLCRLYDAWGRLDEDDSLRVGILTGKGPTFCAGMDLAEIGRLRAGVRDNEWISRLQDDPSITLKAFLKKRRPAKPIILAAEGFARAGGTEILQGTDIRVAGESAVFGVTEVQRGLFPLAGSAVRLRRQIGYAVAAEMLLTGEDLPARRAHELGLVNHVVPDGQALAKAREIADRIARNGPLAVKAILATLRDTECLPEAEAWPIEERYGNAVMRSGDAVEGPVAFLEKREPVFTGT